MLLVKDLGLVPYESTLRDMKVFTDTRSSQTQDNLWLLEHPPVFTQGQAGKPEHILAPHNIPIMQTDRGGQVTYHGPGQLMAYTLFDLKRLKIGPRVLVQSLEQAVIQLMQTMNVDAYAKPKAPGVYISEKKLCSIGLRIRHGYSYHGIALNVSLDLTPFSFINPCGFKGLEMTQVSDYDSTLTMTDIKTQLSPFILKQFGYNVDSI